MTVNEFMNTKLIFIKTIIDNIANNEFDSHEFIRKFAKEYEFDYVKFLSHYDSEPFKKVHSQIAIFLLNNKAYFKIENGRKGD